MFSCDYCEIFKNSFFYRAPLVAASDYKNRTVTDFVFNVVFSQITCATLKEKQYGR